MSEPVIQSVGASGAVKETLDLAMLDNGFVPATGAVKETLDLAVVDKGFVSSIWCS